VQQKINKSSAEQVNSLT